MRTFWYWCGIVLLLFSTVSILGQPTARAQQGAQATPLFADGFEAGLGQWQTCGGSVGLTSTASDGANAAHSGNRALKLAVGSGSGCPQPRSGDFSFQGATTGAAWHAVAFPANLTALTLSLWYKSEGSAGVVDVLVANTLYREDLGNSSGTVAVHDQMRLPLSGLPGWQLYRVPFTAGAVAALKGRSFNLAFTLVGDGTVPKNDPPQGALLIDDVQLIPATVQTTPAARPADLVADGSRPIAFIGLDAPGPGTNTPQQHLYRMDADGSNRVRTFSGQRDSIQAAAWSPNGAQIAVSEDIFVQPALPDTRFYQASQVSVINANGSGQRMIMQTAGQIGSPCPWAPTDPAEQPTINTIVRDLSWASNQQQVAATFTAIQFYCSPLNPDGSINPAKIPAETSNINLRNANGSGALTTVQNGGSSDWNNSGRMLFDVQDSFVGLLAPNAPRQHGIWERNWSAQPPAELLLEPIGSLGDELSSPAEDNYPRWAPDGRHFAVIRPTASGQIDSNGNFVSNNQAIMLYDRNDMANPRMLLLADNGRIDDSKLAWSPNGNFILYTFTTTRAPDGSFTTDYSQYDIWWLDVRSGATGPLTSGGGNVRPDWRWGTASPAPGGVKVFLPTLIR